MEGNATFRAEISAFYSIMGLSGAGHPKYMTVSALKQQMM